MALKKEMKYIMVDHNGIEAPIIFPHVLKHIDVAKGYKVIGAGFISTDGKVTGKSTSLNMGPSDIDQLIISMFI